jgi:hypothetical protein
MAGLEVIQREMAWVVPVLGRGCLWPIVEEPRRDTNCQFRTSVENFRGKR